MLLTIHNLPITTRYTDVKTLLHEKCGLTDIIVDNLVNEGQGKKVTVGLANEDDGAFVVRKLNGLFINGQQLYIEHKGRNATVHEQPYRPPVNLVQESRGFEQAHINNMVQTAMAPNAPNWNQNVTAPYMSFVPVDQNVAYLAYGAVPQPTLYVEPRPVPVENERYSGFQGDNFIQTVPSGGPVHQAPDWGRNGREPPSGPVHQAPDWGRNGREPPSGPVHQAPDWGRNVREPPSGPVHQAPDWGRNVREPPSGPVHQAPDWGRNGREPPSGPVHQAPDWGRNVREPPSDAPRHDRKRRHSPERPAAPKLSRKETRILAAQKRREENARAEPPRQWAEPNQGPRPPFRQPEQPRNQHQNVDDRYPRNQNPSVGDRFPRDQHQNVDGRFPRDQRQNSGDRFSRSQHQNVDDRYQPREPSPPYRHTDPQWEPRRCDEPKPNPREREREWGNDNRENWETEPVKVWDNTPEQWREKPSRWDDGPKPQWEGNYSGMPVEDNRAEWYGRQESVSPPRQNVPEFHPREQGRVYREPRPRKSRFDDRNSAPNRNSGPDNRSGPRPSASSNRQGRPVKEMQRRDRPPSKNGRREREWRDDRPNAPVNRSGGPKKPEFGKQGPKNYPESKRQQRPEFIPKDVPRHAVPRQERDEMYRRKPFVKEENNYPPRKPNQPESLRAMINKDHTNRGQATALIARTVIGLKKGVTYVPNSPFDTYLFRKLKRVIRARVDVELGEGLSTDVDDVVLKYRTKYPINQDRDFLKQVRETATNEYELNQGPMKEENIKETITKIEVKKEPEAANSQKEDILNQARVEDEIEHKETKDEAATGDVKIPVPPNMPKRKPGKPLTDKQIIQHMKLQRKWEYDQDDLYSLDGVNNKALEDEMAELEKLFTGELKPDDPQEETICKIVTTESLNDFNKTLRLYITKRFLKIPTGLTVRIFGQGKLPRKTAMKEYLKKYRINSMTLKKSVKGTMMMVNLTRFEDFDNLCRIEHDVIDGIPVSFKAMHLIGPPPNISKNQVKAMRERFIHGQIDQNPDLGEFEDTADYGEVENENLPEEEFAEDKDFAENEEFPETEDFTEDAEAGNLEGEDFAEDTAGVTEDFGEDINIGNINEEDLEDF